MLYAKETMRTAMMVSLVLSCLGFWTPTANAGEYGCYLVTAPKSLNIRARAWSKSEILASANRGTILKKWKAFCAIRGFWCPVQLGSIKGHAAKKYLEKHPCP